MARIATFGRRKTGTAIEDKKYSTAMAPKKLVDTLPAFEKDSTPLPSSSNSRSDEILRRESTKRLSKQRHSRRGSNEVEWRSFPLKSSKGNYHTNSETESEYDEQSVHNLHVPYSRARDSSTDNDLLVDRHRKSRRNCDKELLVIRPINERFHEALNYST